jgi:YHS domain-containing protein
MDAERGRHRTGVILVPLAVTVLAIAACGEREAPARTAATTVESATPSAAPANPTAADLAVLAAADRADGTEDRAVRLCPGCSLAMEGSAEHALELGGYELHFCSAPCREHFAEHPESGIEALAEVTAKPAASDG